MTMTDEAKALAKRASIGLTPYEACVLARYIEDTEARHAAELREQAERFSEVAYRAKDMLDTFYRNGAGDFLAPFILPAPDPLVEALREAYDAAVAELGEDYIRKLSWFPSNRKIGEAGE